VEERLFQASFAELGLTEKNRGEKEGEQRTEKREKRKQIKGK
jgi:hypothetical protein